MSSEKKPIDSDTPSMVLSDSPAQSPLAIAGLVLAVLVAIGLFFLWQTERKANTFATQALADESASRKTTEDAVKKQLTDLSSRLDMLGATAAKLAEEKAALEKDLAASRAELAGKLEEVRTDARKEIATLGDGMNAVKDDFRNLKETNEGEKNRMAKKLGQVDEDFTYIKDELGKKAEKSYLKFLKRDLMNEIGNVSSNLEAYKVEVDNRIKGTDAKLAEMGSALEKRVDQKVDDATKLGFVATDDEKAKLRKPLPDTAAGADGKPAAVEEVPAGKDEEE